jgi:hypothetical protein
MESSDYYKTTGGVKHMGTQNRQEMVAVHRPPCAPTPLLLILMYSIRKISGVEVTDPSVSCASDVILGL